MADISVTAANVLASSQATIRRGIAGATITAGQVVYEDSTASNKFKLADANASAATAAPVGIALHGAADGQPLAIATEDPDFTPGGTLSITAASSNGVYVLSATAGGFCLAADLAAGHYPNVLMVAKSTTKAVLKIVHGTAALA